MCFSATASFTASALLGAVGVASVIKTYKMKVPRSLPIAAMPLIFSIQQAIEGGLWLTIQGNGSYTGILTSLFLFFALFWWPLFVPLSLYLIEPVQWRRRIMSALSAVGFVLGSYLFVGYLMHPTSATIVNHCIYYDYSVPYSAVGVTLYLLVTVGAGLLSSKRIIRVLYSLITILAFIAWQVYLINFTSVWCFFAAIVSVIIYYFVSTSSSKKLRTSSKI